MVAKRSLLLSAASGLLLLLGAPARSAIPTAAGNAPVPTAQERSTSSQPTDRRQALAERLSRNGVVFYGAYWCGHCQHQKDLFGSQATLFLPYVECERDDAGRSRCQKAGVRAYPTWVIGSERREGTLSLEELEAWLDAARPEQRPTGPAPRP